MMTQVEERLQQNAERVLRDHPEVAQHLNTKELDQTRAAAKRGELEIESTSTGKYSIIDAGTGETIATDYASRADAEATLLIFGITDHYKKLAPQLTETQIWQWWKDPIVLDEQ